MPPVNLQRSCQPAVDEPAVDEPMSRQKFPQILRPKKPSYVLLEQKVLRQIRDPFLGDDHVGLDAQDVVAQRLHFLLLLFEHELPVGFLRDLHIGLGFALLVLHRAIEENDPRVLDLPSHSRVGDVLVEHHTLEHSAILQLAASDFLHLRESVGEFGRICLGYREPDNQKIMHDAKTRAIKCERFI